MSLIFPSFEVIHQISAFHVDKYIFSFTIIAENRVRLTVNAFRKNLSVAGMDYNSIDNWFNSIYNFQATGVGNPGFSASGGWNGASNIQFSLLDNIQNITVMNYPKSGGSTSSPDWSHTFNFATNAYYNFAGGLISIPAQIINGSTYNFSVSGVTGGNRPNLSANYSYSWIFNAGSDISIGSGQSIAYTVPESLSTTNASIKCIVTEAGTGMTTTITQSLASVITIFSPITAIKTELNGNNFIVYFNTVSGFAYNYELSSSNLTTQNITSTTTQTLRNITLNLPNLNSSRSVTLVGKSGSTIATKIYTFIIPTNPTNSTPENVLQNADKPFIYNTGSGKRLAAKVSELTGVTLDMQTTSGAALKSYIAPSGVDKVDVAITERPSNAGGIIKELAISSVKLNSSGQRVYSTLNSTATYSTTIFTVPSNTTAMYIYWDPSGNDNASQFKYLMKRDNGVNYWNVSSNLSTLANAVWTTTSQYGTTLTAGTPTGTFTYFGPSSTINIIYTSQQTSSMGNTGRYIRIERTRTATGVSNPMFIINLTELQAYDQNNNLISIIGSNVTSSSTHTEGANPQLVDGQLVSLSNAYNFCHTSNTDTTPWVQVDLGSDKIVSKIVITNRTDCCQERAIGLTLYLKTSSGTTSYTGAEIQTAEATYTYTLNAASSATSLPCFVAGTRILTPVGEKLVESLKTGDVVITADGRKVTGTVYSTKITKTTKENAPYLIPANAFRPHFPPQDIILSPKHAIQSSKGIWEIPQFAEGRFPAVQKTRIGESVTYYHIELPNFFTDNLIANGSVCESLGAKIQNSLPKGKALYSFNKKLGGFTRYSPEAAVAKKTK